MFGKKVSITVFFSVLLSLMFSLFFPVSVFGLSEPDLLDPLTIPKFENQLEGPLPVYESTDVVENNQVVRHEYDITMAAFDQQILPASMNLTTPVWGYGGFVKDAVSGESLGYLQSTPGPTIEAVRGVPTQVNWINDISSPHMFAVDPTLHWANPKNLDVYSSFPEFPPGDSELQNPVPLVTHLHGAEVQSFSDGVPDQWYTFDGLHGSEYYTYKETSPNAAVYYYPNLQQPTTLWYHDHALGLTRMNMMAGLAGFYVLREPNREVDYLADLLPSGKYEVPLVIQDRTFCSDGTLFYPQVGINPEVNPYWSHAFLGNSIVVNGKSWPNLDVDQGQYRFRILDASNTRIYSLSFEDAETGQSIPFVQIGSDGGYLKNQVTLDEFIISPSERLDVLVDFSGFAPGSKILMKNSLLTFDFPSEEETIANIMQFTVTGQQGFEAKSLPALLNPTLKGDTFPTLPSPDNTRILTMFQVNGEQGPLIFLLNGQLWSGEVSELPRLGETEEWIIVDITNNAHPIHLHLIQFQVVGRQDIDAPRYAADWISLQREALQNATASPPWPVDFVPEELEVEPYLTGTFSGPALYELGWKDTALVYPNSITKIRARWTSQNGNPFSFDATDGPGYVWHCHLLEHEDNEMMRPYRVLPSVDVSDFPFFEVSLLSGLAVLVVVLVLVFRRKRK